MENKQCAKCNENKPISEFTKCSRNKDGLYHQCKICKINNQKKYKKGKFVNEVLVTQKQCTKCGEVKPSSSFSKHKYNKDGLRCDCRECVRSYNRLHREYINNKANIYWREKGYILQRINRHKRYHSDYLYKLKSTLRSRVSNAFRNLNYKKDSTTHELLGAEWLYVKEYIEKQFIEGMTWDNHGEWHIDHILPLSAGKTEEELIKLCHYLNLQPLWGPDNQSKGYRYIKEEYEDFITK